MTRIEKPKERDAARDVERPVKDEIEVLQLKDCSRSSLSRGNLRPFVLKAENKTGAAKSDNQRLNGYSNGYGSASDMEVTDEIVDDEIDNLSDDGVDLEDLPLPPSPPRKVLLSHPSFPITSLFLRVLQKMTENEMLEHQLLIERLQAELRTEEMRLVLLKKIRQSQLLAAQQQQQATAQATSDAKSGTDTCSSLN